MALKASVVFLRQQIHHKRQIVHCARRIGKESPCSLAILREDVPKGCASSFGDVNEYTDGRR